MYNASMNSYQCDPTYWSCPGCGSSVVKQHSMEHRSSNDDGFPSFLTTRKQRLDNPDLKPAGWHDLLWVLDETWMECDGCGRELSEEEIAKVAAHMVAGGTVEKDDIDQKLADAIEAAKKIELLPCPHCGGNAKLQVEIWGSSGEDRLGAYVTCGNGIIHEEPNTPFCWARSGALQEGPGFLEQLARMWNRRREPKPRVVEHPVSDMSKSKMYILLKDIDLGHAALACAHGSLGGYLDFVANETRKWREDQTAKGNVLVSEFEWDQEYAARMRSAIAELGSSTAARCVANSMSAWVKEGDVHPTNTEKWAASSFRKCVCSVTDEQFEKAKSYGKPGEDYRVMTESGLGGMEVAIVFRPKVEWEPFFKSLRLWGKQ